MIKIEGLSKAFDGVTVLDNISSKPCLTLSKNTRTKQAFPLSVNIRRIYGFK